MKRFNLAAVLGFRCSCGGSSICLRLFSIHWHNGFIGSSYGPGVTDHQPENSKFLFKSIVMYKNRDFVEWCFHQNVCWAHTIVVLAPAIWNLMSVAVMLGSLSLGCHHWQLPKPVLHGLNWQQFKFLYSRWPLEPKIWYQIGYKTTLVLAEYS